MIIIVYSNTNETTIEQDFGIAEYSYYFVLKEFLPVLKEIGNVVDVKNLTRDVDAIYKESKARGEDCIFLSFSPPHKTDITLECPTIPVLAWEFEQIPTEFWDNNQKNDWRFVLGKLGFAITHSSHTARAIKTAMRQDYPVAAIAAPVWDRYNHFYNKNYIVSKNKLSLKFRGHVLDTNDKEWQEKLSASNCFSSTSVTKSVSGTIYTTVLNPLDGRKNWEDIVTAFCHALSDKDDATLILKFTNKHTSEWLDRLIETLSTVPKHQCRVLMLNGFLDDKSYESLATKTTYTVNASKGEGQCLPLMEYMSAGKPAISPFHTGMEDYITKDNAFIVDTHVEPTPWPDDNRRLYRSYFHRVCWESLYDCYLKSYDTANNNPNLYKKMSKNAVKQLRSHSSQKSIKKKLNTFFKVHKKHIDSSKLL